MKKRRVSSESEKLRWGLAALNVAILFIRKKKEWNREDIITYLEQYRRNIELDI